MITFKLEFPTIQDKTAKVGYLKLTAPPDIDLEFKTNETLADIESRTFTTNATDTTHIKTYSIHLVCPIITSNVEIPNVTGHVGVSYDSVLELPVNSKFSFGKYFDRAEQFNFILNKRLHKLNSAGGWHLDQLFKDMTNIKKYPVTLFAPYKNVLIRSINEIFMNNTKLTGLDNQNGIMNPLTEINSVMRAYSHTGITNVPENFFLYNRKIIHFDGVFEYCPNLVDVAPYTINFRV